MGSGVRVGTAVGGGVGDGSGVAVGSGVVVGARVGGIVGTEVGKAVEVGSGGANGALWHAAKTSARHNKQASAVHKSSLAETLTGGKPAQRLYLHHKILNLSRNGENGMNEWTPM